MTGGDWFSGNIASFETSGVNVKIKNTFIIFKFIFMERHFLLIWFWPSLTDMYVSVDLMMILLLILKSGSMFLIFCQKQMTNYFPIKKKTLTEITCDKITVTKFEKDYCDIKKLKWNMTLVKKRHKIQISTM